MTVTINFAKIRDTAIIPSKRHEDAGYDIYADFEGENIFVAPHETVGVPTGIASAIPSEYYFQIQERGSTGSIGMKYGAGVIDSGYRGEWFIPITNANTRPLIITKTPEKDYGDAIVYPASKGIAQAVLLPVPTTVIKEIDFSELKKIPSERGAGALGSSGK